MNIGDYITVTSTPSGFLIEETELGREQGIMDIIELCLDEHGVTCYSFFAKDKPDMIAIEIFSAVGDFSEAKRAIESAFLDTLDEGEDIVWDSIPL